MAFQPDGGGFYVGRTTGIQLWSLGRATRRTREFGEADRDYEALAVSPDGDRLLSISTAAGTRGNLDSPRRVTLWNGKKGEVISRLEGLTAAPPTAVAFVPNNEDQVLIGTREGELCVWDMKTQARMARVQVHTRAANRLEVSQDGRYAVSG